jgi:hypothetical protein
MVMLRSCGIHASGNGSSVRVDLSVVDSSRDISIPARSGTIRNDGSRSWSRLPISGVTAVLAGDNRKLGRNLQKRSVVCLNALAELLDPERDEIVFVDHGSPDDVPTFPVAVRDVLAPRTVSLLRVLRLREAMLRKREGVGVRLEVGSVALNAAVRRAKPSSRWILCIGPESVLVPRSAGTVTAGLEEGFLHLGGIPVPHRIWENFDRRDGATAMERLAAWRETSGDSTGGSSGLGEGFLLALKNDIISLGGSDELAKTSTLDAISNLVGRLGRLRGIRGSSSGAFDLFHLAHP